MWRGVWTPQADGCSGLHGRGLACQRTGQPQLCFHCVCSWWPHGESSITKDSSKTTVWSLYKGHFGWPIWPLRLLPWINWTGRGVRAVHRNSGSCVQVLLCSRPYWLNCIWTWSGGLIIFSFFCPSMENEKLDMEARLLEFCIKALSCLWLT